jgi:hypothetical protein
MFPPLLARLSVAAAVTHTERREKELILLSLSLALSLSLSLSPVLRSLSLPTHMILSPVYFFFAALFCRSPPSSPAGCCAICARVSNIRSTQLFHTLVEAHYPQRTSHGAADIHKHAIINQSTTNLPALLSSCQCLVPDSLLPPPLCSFAVVIIQPRSVPQHHHTTPQRIRVQVKRCASALCANC